jgi:hypothetical protein
MTPFLAGHKLFPPGPRLAGRASVQSSIKRAFLALFASVRKGAPHAHKKWEKCPFNRHLHACTLTNAQIGAGTVRKSNPGRIVPSNNPRERHLTGATEAALRWRIRPLSTSAESERIEHI